LTECRKILISDFIKICVMVPESFHADRWTDGWTDRHDEANSHLVAILRTHLKMTHTWIYEVKTALSPLFCVILKWCVSSDLDK